MYFYKVVFHSQIEEEKEILTCLTLLQQLVKNDNKTPHIFAKRKSGYTSRSVTELGTN